MLMGRVAIPVVRKCLLPVGDDIRPLYLKLAKFWPAKKDPIAKWWNMLQNPLQRKVSENPSQCSRADCLGGRRGPASRGSGAARARRRRPTAVEGHKLKETQHCSSTIVRAILVQIIADNHRQNNTHEEKSVGYSVLDSLCSIPKRVFEGAE